MNISFGDHASRGAASALARGVAAMGLLLLPGCIDLGADAPPLTTASQIEPVYILETEQLAAPVVSERGNVIRAYRPEQFFVLRAGADPMNGFGFFLTVATSRPDQLHLRIRKREAADATPLVFADGPATPGQRRAGEIPEPYTANMRADMLRGQGFFWLAGEVESAPGQFRYAVVLPDALVDDISDLDAYVTSAEDGSPLGADRLTIARDFYYLAVIGDSIQWGNGLPEFAKMSALVSDVIERETGRMVIRQRYAHSGARIVPAEGDGLCFLNCVGEVPTISTSITAQADLIERPEMMDLILMDGCINDVDVFNIINPLTTAEDLTESTRLYCGTEMTALLRKVRGLAPQATIVVTGYFQIVGPESDLFAMQQWSRTHGLPSDDNTEHFIEKLIENSLTFVNTAHESISVAVETVNAENPDQARIMFANPGFGAEHAVFTAQRWLWSLTTQSRLFGGLNLELQLFPEDPQEFLRIAGCFEPNIVGGTLFCLYASVGHPNISGARAYANAILTRLHEVGLIPEVQLEIAP